MKSMRLVGFVGAGLLAVIAGIAGCNNSKESSDPKPAPSAGEATSAAAASAKAAPVGSAATASADGALHLGTPIEATAQTVALAEVAKNPQAFVNKTFATTGTVTAVCQHMGCWMEIKDDASEAHIKMAGHAFFVPKTAAGHKARVLATLVKSDAPNGACADEGDEGKMATAGGAGAKPAASAGPAKSGCRAEAEAQLGRPLAKLELVAQGVELN